MSKRRPINCIGAKRGAAGWLLFTLGLLVAAVWAWSTTTELSRARHGARVFAGQLSVTVELVTYYAEVVETDTAGQETSDALKAEIARAAVQEAAAARLREARMHRDQAEAQAKCEIWYATELAEANEKRPHTNW